MCKANACTQCICTYMHCNFTFILASTGRDGLLSAIRAVKTFDYIAFDMLAFGEPRALSYLLKLKKTIE